MNKKYKIREDLSKVLDTGETVYRIEALKDFEVQGLKIKKGDLGGWIASYDNLSQEGNCWVMDECVMHGNSMRSGNSLGMGNAQQFGNSRQSGNSLQYSNSRQYENSWQSGDSWQFGNSRQYGNSQQYGDSRQFGNSRQSGDSQQYGNSWQSGNSRQFDNSRQSGNSRQYGDSQQFVDSQQYGDSRQGGDFKHTHGSHASCSNTGQLTEAVELVEFANVGIYRRTINLDITTGLVNVNNCFLGTIDELEAAVVRKYGSLEDSKGYDRVIRIGRVLMQWENGDEKDKEHKLIQKK